MENGPVWCITVHHKQGFWICALQVAAAKRQMSQEQRQLHMQLLREQDEEVCKLRQLLKVQQGQLAAQEQQHVQDVSSLQTSIQEQQQRAALMQQKAAQQEAECTLLKTYCI